MYHTTHGIWMIFTIIFQVFIFRGWIKNNCICRFSFYFVICYYFTITIRSNSFIINSCSSGSSAKPLTIICVSTLDDIFKVGFVKLLKPTHLYISLTNLAVNTIANFPSLLSFSSSYWEYIFTKICSVPVLQIK